MKNLITLIIPFHFLFVIYGCASFTPGSLNTSPAVSTPGSTMKDSIALFIREISPRESKRIFDCNIYNGGYIPLSIALSNRSNSTIDFTPNSISQYENVDNVLSATDYHPAGRLITWSIPWIINILLHQPFYYGIAWPIFGLIDMVKAGDANNERGDYFYSVLIKPTILQPGQDIQGVMFVRKNYSKPLQIILLKNNNQMVFDIIPTK